MMTTKYWVTRGVILLFSIFITACGSSDTVVFQPSLSVTVNMEATDDINVFEDNEPRPVILRLYQLEDIGNFKNADFISLYNSDKTVLGGALIDSQVLSPVIPGEKREFVLEVAQQAKFVAVLAEFADYEVATTKAFVALVEEPEESPITIGISRSKVEISQPVDSSWW